MVSATAGRLGTAWYCGEKSLCEDFGCGWYSCGYVWLQATKDWAVCGNGTNGTVTWCRAEDGG